MFYLKINKFDIVMILEDFSLQLFENFYTLDEINKSNAIKLLHEILNNYGENFKDSNILIKFSRRSSRDCDPWYIVEITDANSNYLYCLDIDMATLEIVKISKYEEKEKIEDIMSNCELKPFPFTIDENRMLFTDDNYNVYMKENDHVYDINITYDNDVYNSVSYYADEEARNSYRPLMKNERIKNDKLFRMPSYDSPNKLAFALARYNFGLNLCAAYLDLDKKTFYCNEHINYDYPEGLAIKYIPEEHEIMVYTDMEPEEIIIHDSRQNKPENDFRSFYQSGWIKFYFRYKFFSIDIHLNNTKYKHDDEYSELQNKVQENMEAKQYEEALKYCYECLKKDPNDDIILYNTACYNSILNNKETSLEYLKLAIEKGYMDWKYMIKDSDFENIRKEPEYKEIIMKLMERDPVAKSTKDFMESIEFQNIFS